jgi:hypothetical protein
MPRTDKERGAAYQRAWRAKNHEKQLAYERRYRELHPERVKASSAKWAAANRPKIRERVRQTWAARPDVREKARLYMASNRDKVKVWDQRRRLKVYGLTEEAYGQMLAAQDGCCAICHTDKPGGHGTWCIDHDHDTGFVRGLLCVLCNYHLHAFEKKSAEIEAFLAYLAVAAEKQRRIS